MWPRKRFVWRPTFYVRCTGAIVHWISTVTDFLARKFVFEINSKWHPGSWHVMKTIAFHWQHRQCRIGVLCNTSMPKPAQHPWAVRKCHFRNPRSEQTNLETRMEQTNGKEKANSWPARTLRTICIASKFCPVWSRLAFEIPRSNTLDTPRYLQPTVQASLIDQRTEKLFIWGGMSK